MMTAGRKAPSPLIRLRISSLDNGGYSALGNCLYNGIYLPPIFLMVLKNSSTVGIREDHIQFPFT